MNDSFIESFNRYHAELSRELKTLCHGRYGERLIFLDVDELVTRGSLLRMLKGKYTKSLSVGETLPLYDPQRELFEHHLRACFLDCRFLYLTKFSKFYNDHIAERLPSSVHDGLCIAKTIYGTLRYRREYGQYNHGAVDEAALVKIASYDGQEWKNRRGLAQFLEHQLKRWLTDRKLTQEATRVEHHRSAVVSAKQDETIRIPNDLWLNMGVFRAIPSSECCYFAVFTTFHPWSELAHSLHPTGRDSVFWGVQDFNNFSNVFMPYGPVSVSHGILTRVCCDADVVRVGYLEQSVFPIQRANVEEENKLLRECLCDLIERIYENRRRIKELFSLLDALTLVRSSLSYNTTTGQSPINDLTGINEGEESK